VSAREDYIAGLRAFADLLESTPDLTLPTHGGAKPYTALQWLLFDDPDDSRDQAAAVVRAAGGHWDKEISGEYARYHRAIEGLHLEVAVRREAVCERIVTGTETVTRLVPAPDAPMVEVTETVETVEWVCQPLLAERAS